MLERYFVKPQTVDRIRASWIGSEIEQYVDWLAEREYSTRSVLHRVRGVRVGRRRADGSGAARSHRAVHG